jgi:hypothetical protein
MIYTLRNCTIQELPLLQDFLHKHWKENHALSKSESLMNFQHLNHNHKNYNFIIAINNETNEIDGIIGHIPVSHYDISLSDNGDYWGAIWKIRTDVNNEEIKMLGLLLWEDLFYKKDLKTIAAIGISNTAKQFYKLLHLRGGVLNQYYILREQNASYQIAISPINNKLTVSSQSNHIRKIDLNDNIRIEPVYRPYKSITYMINRYKYHPIYNYEFFLILDKCLLVTRKIIINNQSILRIVDCLGNLEGLPDLYADFQSILKSENAEYIDFMNYGIDESIFTNIGFQKLDVKEEIVIPNYFEPFLQKNIEIEFAYKATYPYVIFKGDSDQDRPNIL